MAPLRYLFCLLYSVSSVFGEYQQVILGDAVTFTATGKCAKGKEARLEYRVDERITRPVAVLQQGVWLGLLSDYYKDRVISRNSCVVFNRTFYTDTGSYELTCGEDIKIIQLVVVLASKASVTEGETATLQCYYIGQYVRWERNGELVLELNCSSGRIRYGTGFEGRASVSSDCKQGDFSLILEKAEMEDRGDYFCYGQSNGEKERGNPAAVRLTTNPEQTTPFLNTTQSLTGEETETWTNESVIAWLAVAIVVALVVGIVVGIGLGWLLTSSASPGPPARGDLDVALRPLNSQSASPAQANG
ncbi:uncharacterized protein LOC122973795 [Thunnus albacares]|uniref:uncharacterized protein LOC122973795 n=1 Tax=Thunnus albacares TaxID=8236 RepID=UPI001CF6E5E3|nr:uncharacterized protein LOC122973795 [Thunnus albacares]